MSKPQRTGTEHTGKPRRFRHSFEYCGVTLAAKTLPHLPHSSITAVARALGTLYFWLDTGSRRVAVENLQAAFGAAMTPKTRRAVARESACHFAQTFLDLFWARHLSLRNLERYVVFENLESLLAHHRNGGCIGIAIHDGAYELAAYSAGFHGVQATMLARDFKNPRLTTLFRQAREGSGHTIISREKALRRMLAALNQGKTIGVMVDLALKIHEGGFALDCFGLKMNSTAMHGALHLRTGRPIVPISNERLPDGRCLVRVHEPLQFPRDATAESVAQACWDFYEPAIARRPATWLWCYRHFRYRPSDTDRFYPFYAHTAREFDERVAARHQPSDPSEGKPR